MRVFGTGVLGTRYCRVLGSWYWGWADFVGPAVCFICPVLLGGGGFAHGKVSYAESVAVVEAAYE